MLGTARGMADALSAILLPEPDGGSCAPKPDRVSCSPMPGMAA